MKKIAIPLVALVAFSAFSLWVVAAEGYLGFLSLARDEPWGLQLLLDVAIACFLYSIWMVRDARERGLPVAPYLVMMLFGGSIGALAYLVHRGVRAATSAERALSVASPLVSHRR
ncbi:MAG: DUF2834 domain-containing protein [Kofleriaceae bacterium]|nr:MAG: DUF2834 domain-containing protein [Kofleriaceae bacterium]